MIRPKFALTALLTILFIYQASSQTNYNLQLISETSYPNNCIDSYSDVWGFRHSNGTEYAIIGGRCHTLIYDLSNPSAPSLIAEIEGDSSIWRDMKSYGDYVFSIADQGDDGLTIIDLTDPTMPNDTSFKPAFGTRFLERGHNLFIDHRGLLYIAGSNINNGGALIYDVSVTPMAPTLSGIGSGNYAHDVFVVGDNMITSELGTGFRISSLVFFGNLVFAPTEAIQETGNDFTHNAWSTADGSTLFTTDERSDAFVEAYDISDFNTGIDFLGRWSSPTTVGSGVIPHNVHVTEADGCTWLIVSYYTDGVKIVDATDPSRMVEVGCYDTSPLSGSGFNGAWGATPPLPSGHILVSDIERGLMVFQPTFKKSVYVEGKVIDGMTGDSIPGATIKIVTFDTLATTTDIEGLYFHGMVDQSDTSDNTVQIIVCAPGYSTKDTTLNLLTDSIITIDFSLLQAIVPVELISFSVEDLECGNMLKWVVGSEINHSHFEVQVSFDGLHFESVAKIYPGEKQENIYHYEHPVSEQKRMYYRLLQKDLDGTTSLSRVVQSFGRCETGSIQIAPNPSRGITEIRSPLPVSAISLYHPSGTLVKHQDFDQPDLIQSLDISELPNGVYTLLLHQEGKAVTRRIVKLD